MKKIVYSLLAILLLVSCGKSNPTELNVMSFNMRYDNPEDSLNSWQYRKDIVAQTITDCNTDIIGTQEVLINQMNDLKSLLPQYNSVGVGRLDGIEKGEFSAIFYKKERFKEIESGYFWLSETPDIAGSKGWDGACERIATWTILEDLNNKKQFFVINTHLDHIGKMARQEGVTLLLDQTKKLSKELPVIITGDFNASPESDVIKHVTNSNLFVHTQDIASAKEGTDWTFHGFGKVPMEEREFIDYIFVSNGVKVSEHKILPEKLNDKFISDHSVVFSHIEIR